jgi:acyl-[acyl carrier protein]--UDP-N-acetylglucosamine O-acyltransferase
MIQKDFPQYSAAEGRKQSARAINIAQFCRSECDKSRIAKANVMTTQIKVIWPILAWRSSYTQKAAPQKISPKITKFFCVYPVKVKLHSL